MKYQFSPLAQALSLALFACACPVQAQEKEALQKLPPVLVTGSAIAATGLNENAGSSSRLGLSLRETPASVSVLDREEIELRGASNTQEILKSVPGLIFADPPGSAGTVFYRGFGSGSLSQLYNGISVQYDAIAARPVDSWIVERVEAIGGPSSFLNGSGAVGGTLNVITKIADRSGDQGRLRFGLGDSGRGQAALSLQRGVAEQVLRLELNRSEGALWTQGRDRQAWQLAASWLLPLAQNVSHTLAVERQHEKVSQPYWGTPMLQPLGGGAVAGQLRFDPATLGINYNVEDGRYQQDVTWLRSLLDWRLNEHSQLRHTLYHYDALRDFENVETYTFKNGNSQVARSNALLQRHDQQVWGSRWELSHSGQLAGRASDSALGLDWSYNRQTRFPNSVAVIKKPFDLVDPYAPAAAQFYPASGLLPGYTPGASNQLHSLALFAENRTVLGAGFALVSALRFDRISLLARNLRTATASSPALFATTFKPLTGRLGLVKDLSADWQIYAQASTAADPPAGLLATAGFSALRDFDLTRGRQFELGSKLSFDGGRGSATAAVYEIRRRHIAITDPSDKTKVIPVGEQSSLGLELAARWQPSSALSLSGHLSHTRARYEDFVEPLNGQPVSRAGQRPANVPDWVAGAALDWQARASLGLSLDWRYVGRRYANAANDLWDGAYQLLGLGARLQLDPRLSLNLRVDNLTNTRYVANLSSSLPYLGAPRSATAALDWRF
ncbi:iron complex outermembrane receptor protein [Paucibacter oligotrophus]|uniref:Iron complex outermembrane receptor protein n=1 Tax=Roseateles oligotrophus TaxID=1769250 RepID=A0A840L8H0_9BURK|nr:TonB-dependent receptor [Roseateles oligotrophus]MBB4843015.1 iron complex outermembrane receptor protein [Roseateles oligotrophus]